MDSLSVIIGFLFIGWLSNIFVEIFEWIIKCIENKNWFCLALPFVIISLGVFITWLLYHFGIYSFIDNLAFTGSYK